MPLHPDYWEQVWRDVTKDPQELRRELADEFRKAMASYFPRPESPVAKPLPADPVKRRREAIRRRVLAGERPGQNVQHKTFTDNIRADCGVKLGQRGFGDKQITRITQKILAELG